MGMFWRHMKKKPYVASTDYGKRNYELDKDIMHFGSYAVTLYRRPDAKKSGWYFRTYIKEEKRHYRQSLKTTNLNRARSFAHDQMVTILAKVQSGHRFNILP